MKIIRFLLTITAGAMYGLLFAQKPGKKFREELKKSKQPIKTFFNECKEVDMEAMQTFSQWAKNSEDVQKLLAVGHTQFKEFVNGAKKLGKDGKETARQKLEELSQEAAEAAEELKDTVAEKGDKIQKAIKTVAKNIKK